MDNYFENKVVVVLTPQPWNYLFISKHHYARTLARSNKVFFVEPPAHGKWFSYSVTPVPENNNLNIVRYALPLPNWLRFKLPALYKAIHPFFLRQVLQKIVGTADACIDFGCFAQFNSIRSMPAGKKIFFAADDFISLKPDMRGADIVVTVSKNIQRKFPDGVCHFINHGLAEEFAVATRKDISAQSGWKPSGRIKVGYAGNLFLRFIDAETMMLIIGQNPKVEFHFFGSCEPDRTKPWQVKWHGFLQRAANVHIHGMVSPANLVVHYRDMDAFLLCYQPDRRDYHGENSHKIMEYLSTGKVTIASFIYVYENTGLIEMPSSSDNKSMPALFSKVINDLAAHNASGLMDKRRNYSLQHTYLENIKRISSFLHER